MLSEKLIPGLTLLVMRNRNRRNLYCAAYFTKSCWSQAIVIIDNMLNKIQLGTYTRQLAWHCLFHPKVNYRKRRQAPFSVKSTTDSNAKKQIDYVLLLKGE